MHKCLKWNNMERTNFFEELKRYFENTSDEQIFKGWKECEKFDNIGPTVDEFFSYAAPYYQTILENPRCSDISMKRFNENH